MIGNLKMHLTADADYYTACFSNRFDSRLFDDFDADACLVVTDPVAFVERIRSAVAEILPNWKFSNANVRYRDPFFPAFDKSVVFAKHFRYAYQDEFRCAWQPPASSENLDYLPVRMGALGDIAQLLFL